MGLRYTKQALDYPQIIQQLKDRGLRFHDEQKAITELRNISYFRIANYLRFFEQRGTDCHEYKANTYFEDALHIYYFDKQLRALLFTAIQTIEIAFRSKVIHHVALAHGPFWFADNQCSNNRANFIENLNKIKGEVKRSKEEFIQEHRQKYSDPDVPPVWKTLEVASFGTLSKLFCNLNDNRTKKRIAREFNLPQHAVLESWIKAIVVLRNCIAHHSRAWNRRYAQIPQLSSLRMRGAWVDCSHVRPVKLFAQLCCLAYLQDNIHPGNDFKKQLKDLLKANPQISLYAMGFPANWQDEPLWKN